MVLDANFQHMGHIHFKRQASFKILSTRIKDIG